MEDIVGPERTLKGEKYGVEVRKLTRFGWRRVKAAGFADQPRSKLAPPITFHFIC
jgi:hypothetical protein